MIAFTKISNREIKVKNTASSASNRTEISPDRVYNYPYQLSVLSLKDYTFSKIFQHFFFFGNKISEVSCCMNIFLKYPGCKVKSKELAMVLEVSFPVFSLTTLSL